MSFFGRVVADAQRRETQAPLARAMPVPDAAAFGAPVDTAFDSPFSMEVDAFSDQPAMPARASAAASDLVRSHVATAAGNTRPLDDTGTRSSSTPLANVAGATDREAMRVPGGAAHVGVAQPPTAARGALLPPDEGAHAAAQFDAAGFEASGRGSRSQLPVANLPALASDQHAAHPASAEHGTAAANRASVGLSRVEMDAWIDRGARAPHASHSGIDTRPAVAASAVSADVSLASQPPREQADPAQGGAPQDIRQALAQVDAQATRLQRMLAVDPPPSVPTQAMRSPPSAPVRSDASMQVTRSTPLVRIDHVDIVVTEPPSRPRRSVQERPGNPASRNYLRRL